MKNHLALGHVLALAVSVVWGTTYISTKVLLTAFHPVEILIFRFLLAWAVLFLLSPKPLLPKSLKGELPFLCCGLTGLTFYSILENYALLLLCEQVAKNFHTICKKETALKRVLSNLLSAVSLLRFKAVFSCGFRVPPGSGLYQSCAAGSVCIPAGQKYCSPRPRKSCPADRKTPGLPSRCIGHRW